MKGDNSLLYARAENVSFHYIIDELGEIMMNYVQDINSIMEKLDTNVRESIGMDVIVIEAGALSKLVPYVQQRGMTKVMLVADSRTYEVAAKQLEQYFNEADTVEATTTLLTANKVGDVIADEQTIVELLLALQQHHPDVVIAVGSGTIHDVVRYAAYTVSLPFISVPTAPSVDGFNSKGAPIIIRGFKKTIVAIGPDAVFADLDILVKAPKSLIAAGFGDILGKYTSLFDWKFGSLTNNEPYLPISEEITVNALRKCVQATDSIAAGEEAGIAHLMSALIESGIAMLIFGKSHPASGAEHHISHYWEMEFIKQGYKQLLHGAKVGVSCIQIATLYHQLAEQDFGLQPNVKATVAEHWDEIKQLLSELPSAQRLTELLSKVGGPTTIAELSISPQLCDISLEQAHHIRSERYTLLHAYNTMV